jgi:PAS domain-containing protein
MTEPARAGLPLDGEAIVKLAARSMFELFSDMAQGMMLVDRDGRVVWINEAYKKFLPRSDSSASKISSAARSRRWCRTRSCAM